jgi:2-dehydro-3-deoxygalactonokinase
MRPTLPVIAAGHGRQRARLAGSAVRVHTPASADALVAGIVRVTTLKGVTLHIVPGVLEDGELPNVMRGEETQIFGALAGDATLDQEPHGGLIGLPGTHAKWAVVRRDRIERFHTFMTGESFAALARAHHSRPHDGAPDRMDTGHFCAA